MKLTNFLIILGLIIFCNSKLFAQFQKDESGNPSLTAEYSNDLLQQEFENIKGGVLNLEDYNGKIVVLDFWQTWCKPCLKGFEGLQKAKLEWQDKIEIIAVSPDLYYKDNELLPILDKEDKILEFISKKNYPFQYVFAEELSKELQLKIIPYKIVIAPDGKIIESKSGFGDADKEYKYLNSLVKEYF